jgi:hypothetical protein
MLVSDFSVSGQFPSKLTTPGTSAVYFPRPGLTPATPTATNATGQLTLPVVQTWSVTNGIRLRVIASGTLTTGAASIATTITIQANTGTLLSPAYTTLMTAANTPGAAGTSAWELEAHLVVGGGVLPAPSPSQVPVTQITTGQLVGFYFGSINGALVDLAIIPPTTNPATWGGAGFVANITFGTGNAANAAALSEFEVLGD